MMTWNLQSYPTTVLNERMRHFRGSKHTLRHLLYIFSGIKTLQLPASTPEGRGQPLADSHNLRMPLTASPVPRHFKQYLYRFGANFCFCSFMLGNSELAIDIHWIVTLSAAGNILKHDVNCKLLNLHHFWIWKVKIYIPNCLTVYVLEFYLHSSWGVQIQILGTHTPA